MKKHTFLYILLATFAFIQCKQKEKPAEITVEKLDRDSILANNKTSINADSIANDLEKSEEERLKTVTSIKFDKEVYDFGECVEGDKITKTIEFTNTGKLPLVINQAYGSCGCTVPKFNKEPIQPGKKGQMQIEFDSKNKPGANTKSVTIEANTNPQKTTISFSIIVNTNAKKKKGWFN